MAPSDTPATFASFQAELARLVAQFDRQHPTYTSSDYNEAALRADFLDAFFRALGWDVGNQKGLIHTEREVDIEVRTHLSGRQTRADYVFRLNRTERFTCEAKKPAEVLHNRHIFQAKRDAFARGVPVVRLRYLYTLVGGALIGLAGAAFTLDMKTGWTYRHTAGYGWIALAIVIFGGWNPVRGAIGAYFFGFLETLASFAQSRVENIPTQVFSVLPFVLMILVLALTSGEWLTRLLGHAPPWLRRALSANLNAPAPAALGRPFEQD